MTKTFGNELLEAEVNLHQVEEGAKQHLAPLRAIGRAVFEHWAALNWKLTCVKALPFAPPYCGGN